MSKNKLTPYMCKGIIFRTIMKSETMYFSRADLERIVGSNLHSVDYSIKYKYKGIWIKELFFSLEQLPDLAFRHKNRDLYDTFDFFSKYHYPKLRLHWAKNFLLKTYLFFFGSEK